MGSRALVSPLERTPPASPSLKALERNRHISALDGLRGIAILSVMIFHFGAPRLHPGALMRTAWGPFSNSPIGHFWSLAVEEQFYFVWPAVVFLLPGSRLLWICAAVPLASAALRFAPYLQTIQHTHPEFLYRMTFCRLDGLALGASVAVLVRNTDLTRKVATVVRNLLPLSLAAVALIVFLDHSTMYSGHWMSACGYSVLAILFASVLLLVLVRDSPPAFLESRCLMSFGKYSYGLYVFHVPLLFALAKLPRVDGYLGCVAAIAIGIGLSYLAAYASWHLFEVRFHRLKERLAPALAGARGREGTAG